MEKKISRIISRMTLEEKISMLGGSKNRKEDGGDTTPCRRVGIPSFKMADASVGVHWWAEDSTTFPASIALAATFDRDLAARYGSAVGRECRARGIHILLGPGVNIYRSALCGRNFEYMGEDPFLAGNMVSSYVRGLQGQRVAATVKHYALNFQEYDRHKVSSDVDDRTLREVYLAAFESAVKDGGAAAIMTAYNLVNCVHCAEHPYLIRDVLKNEWGFDGLVMSDWVSVYDAINTATAGLDLEMPVAKRLTQEALLPAVRDGLLDESVIDDKIRRLLRVAHAFGWMDGEQQDKGIPLHDEANAGVALDVARESIVLLSNDGILPLQARKGLKIAVIGPCAHPAVHCGGGSAFNKPWREVSILDGIKAVMPQADVVHVAGVSPWRGKDLFANALYRTADDQPGIKLQLFNNDSLSGEPVKVQVDKKIEASISSEHLPDNVKPRPMSLRYSGRIVAEKEGEHIFRVECWHGGVRVLVDGSCVMDSWLAEMMGNRECRMVLAKGHHEFVLEFHSMRDRAFLRTGYEHISAVNAEVPVAVKAARDADVVVFCGGYSDKSEIEGQDRAFAMHVEIERLLAEVSKVNRNVIVVLTAGGNIDMTAWHDKARAILHAWYPGQEGGTAVAEVLSGKVNPSGRLPATFENRLEDRSSATCYHDADGDQRVALTDGVFGGYRHHDRNGKPPRYAFGHGLSYTAFEFRKLKIERKVRGREIPAVVSFDVVNTGKVAGKCTAQVYVGDDKASVARPVKELKGFAKVALNPGESRRVSVVLDRRAFAFRSMARNKWVVEPGTFSVHVANSATDIRLSAKVKIGKAIEF